MMTLADLLSAVAGPWGQALALVAAAVVLGWLADRLLLAAFKQAAAKTASPLDDLVAKALHPTMLVFLVVAGVLLALRLVRDQLPNGVTQFIGSAGTAIVVILLAFFATRLVAGLLEWRASQVPRFAPAATLGNRLIAAAIYATAFLVVLRAYGQDIGPWVASLGLAGLAVALALQDTLANFFAGVWVQTGRSVRPGHFVRVEEAKVEGYVIEVGWRTTRIRTLGENVVILPNAKLAQSVVTDYYLPSTRMGITIEVSVGFDQDPDRIERLLVEEAKAAAKDVPGLLEQPEPSARFIPGFGEYSLKFSLGVHVREYVDQYLAQHELRKRILARFRKEGIRIPYPIRQNLQARMEDGDGHHAPPLVKPQE